MDLEPLNELQVAECLKSEEEYLQQLERERAQKASKQPAPLTKTLSEGYPEIAKLRRQYSLESWSAEQIRESVNRSTDIDFLEACRQEFHRRAQDAEEASTAIGSTREQRYFWVPLPKKVDEPSKGLWYGHFNGQWIVRQMEVHPDKVPILSVAGKFYYYSLKMYIFSFQAVTT